MVEEWVRCPFRHSPSAFCLVAKSSDPRTKGKQAIFEGDFVAVDPLQDIGEGDLVLFNLNGYEDEPILGTLHAIGTQGEFLVPKDGGEPVEFGAEVNLIGVVVGIWRKF